MTDQNKQPISKVETVKWNEVDADGNIDVPDELMPLFNKIGIQLRMFIISGKNEIKTIADILYLSEKFFKEKYQNNTNHGNQEN